MGCRASRNVRQDSRAMKVVVTKYIVRAEPISEVPAKISISGKAPGFYESDRSSRSRKDSARSEPAGSMM